MSVARDVDVTVSDLGGGSHQLARDVKHKITAESLASGNTTFASTASAHTSMQTLWRTLNDDMDALWEAQNLWEDFEFTIYADDLGLSGFTVGSNPYLDHIVRVVHTDIGGGEERFAWEAWEQTSDTVETPKGSGNLDVADDYSAAKAVQRLRALAKAVVVTTQAATDLPANFTIPLTPRENTELLTLDPPYAVAVVHTDIGGGQERFAYTVSDDSGTIDTGNIDVSDSADANEVCRQIQVTALNAIRDSFTVGDLSATTTPYDPPDYGTGLLNGPYEIEITSTSGTDPITVNWAINKTGSVAIDTGSDAYAASTVAWTVLADLLGYAWAAVQAESAVSDMSNQSFETYGKEEPLFMGPAELPRERLSYSAVPTTSNSVTVKAAGGDYSDLATAIAAEPLDTTIIVDAGMTFTGDIELPKKAGTGWMVIQSSDGTLPAFGTRVAAGDTSKMFTCQITAAGQNVISCADGAHHYWFVGAQFLYNGPANGDVNNIVYLAGTTDTPTAFSDFPHNIVLDRCIIEGNGGDIQNGLKIGASHVAFINGRINECKWSGVESKGIGGFYMPGPTLIENNYILAGSIRILFGGITYPAGTGAFMPSDIEMNRNYLYYPTTYCVWHPDYGGTNYGYKNAIETKSGSRIIIKGNYVKHCPVDSNQRGQPWVMKASNQGSVSATLVTTGDVSVVYNYTEKSAGGLSVNGSETGSKVPKGFYAAHNLFNDCGDTDFYDSGLNHSMGMGWHTGTEKQAWINAEFRNNTWYNVVKFGLAFLSSLGEQGVQPIKFLNNILEGGSFGITSTEGHGAGSTGINNCAPGSVFSKNLLVEMDSGTYPANNEYPANAAAVGYEDQPNGDFSLSSGSSYKNYGTDGNDPGVDMAKLNAKISGVAE